MAALDELEFSFLWIGQSVRMVRLCHYSIDKPLRVMVVAVLLLVAAAPGVLRLKLRTDGHALVPEGAEEVRYDRKVRDAFHVEDPVVVLIRSDRPNGIFKPATLQLIKDLTESFQAIEGIRPEDVSSLATEHSHRVWPQRTPLTFRRFLEPLPKTRAQLARLRGDLAKIKLHTGTVISFDGSIAVILIGVPPTVDN